MSVKENEILWLNEFIQTELMANNSNGSSDPPMLIAPELPPLPTPKAEDFPLAEGAEEVKVKEFIEREIL